MPVVRSAIGCLKFYSRSGLIVHTDVFNSEWRKVLLYFNMQELSLIQIMFQHSTIYQC